MHAPRRTLITPVYSSPASRHARATFMSRVSPQRASRLMRERFSHPVSRIIVFLEEMWSAPNECVCAV
jgi:hypothetical protein